MTWVKLDDSFTDDADEVRLSHPAFRLHVEGLVWVMRRETGGLIRGHELRRAVTLTEAEMSLALPELMDVGWWKPHEDGWLLVHNLDQQRTPEQIACDRKAAAKRKADQRRKAKEQQHQNGQVES